MSKITLYKLIAIAGLLVSGYSTASSLLIEATGDNIEADSSVPFRDQRVPTVGTPASLEMTRTAHAWQPGTFSMSMGTRTGVDVTFQGNTITLPITFHGILYGGVSGFEVEESPFITAPGGDPIVNGNIEIINDGNSEYGLYGILSQYTKQILVVPEGSPPRTPHTYIKPIIEFHESAMIAALRDNRPSVSVPLETYRGQLSIPYQYRIQYHKGGPWTYERRVLNFGVEVNYVRRTITSFTVENGAHQNVNLVYGGGDGESIVTGDAEFIIKAEGFFPDGINLQVNPTPVAGSSDFSLINNTGPEHIPYDLTCATHAGPMAGSQIKCGGSSSLVIVKDGKHINTNKQIEIDLDNPNAERVYFTLGVDFVHGFTKTGKYTDNIVVLASPVIL